MSRSVQPTDYRRTEPPAYRIEWTGGLKNYIPIKQTEIVTCYQRHYLGPGISQEVPHLHEVKK